VKRRLRVGECIVCLKNADGAERFVGIGRTPAATENRERAKIFRTLDDAMIEANTFVKDGLFGTVSAEVLKKIG
jgi:hypothetical protein